MPQRSIAISYGSHVVEAWSQRYLKYYDLKRDWKTRQLMPSNDQTDQFKDLVCIDVLRVLKFMKFVAKTVESNIHDLTSGWKSLSDNDKMMHQESAHRALERAIRALYRTLSELKSFCKLNHFLLVKLLHKTQMCLIGDFFSSSPVFENNEVSSFEKFEKEISKLEDQCLNLYVIMLKTQKADDDSEASFSDENQSMMKMLANGDLKYDKTTDTGTEITRFLLALRIGVVTTLVNILFYV
jgi:SPX domain protein involved in polyphosphate accumulation